MSEPTNASPDGVRSGELDLDGIEARAERFGQPGQSDESMDLAAHYLARQVRPLVAEVRRLRALVPHPDCNCGFGGQHDPDNPRCEANRP